MLELNKILLYLHPPKMEIVAQLVRAPDCGSGGRGFETRLSPTFLRSIKNRPFFVYYFLKIYSLNSQKINYSKSIVKETFEIQ